MKTSSVLHPSYPISIQPIYLIGLDSEVGVSLVRPYSHPFTNSRLSHYHETSGLAQTCEELVHTTQYIYEILRCHTETCVPHHEALAPNIQILNTPPRATSVASQTPPRIYPSLALLLETFGDFATDPPLRTKPQATSRIPISDTSEHRKLPPPSIRICEPRK